MQLIKLKLLKEIGRNEYYLALMELDKKYPYAGFYEAARKYINKREPGEEG